ncbi:hypothetical protein ACFQWC_12880 [Rossellomorea sp. GCM10028870]|uniref:hypothetical protein n=1 Tax=Rossellomorea sp. GCM10028870 TaxID=3273426 RepID=UPI00360E1400
MTERQIRPWSKEEVNFLKEKTGAWTIYGIAHKLGRTPVAVSAKMSKLRIGNTKVQTGLVTAGELGRLLKVDRNTIMGWIRHHGLTCIRRPLSMKDPIIS